MAGWTAGAGGFRVPDGCNRVVWRQPARSAGEPRYFVRLRQEEEVAGAPSPELMAVEMLEPWTEAPPPGPAPPPVEMP